MKRPEDSDAPDSIRADRDLDDSSPPDITGAPSPARRKKDKPAEDRGPDATASRSNKDVARPQTPDQLHHWLRTTLGLAIPRAPMLRGHAAPFDYLCHVYFEGQIPARRAAASSGRRTKGSRRDLSLPQLHAPEPAASDPILEETDAVSPPNDTPTSDVPTKAPAPNSPGDCVVWANRGGGKTFLGAVATVLDLYFKPGIEVRILAGSLDQSKRMYAHLRRLFVTPVLATEVRGSIKERRIVLQNGSELELLAASQASVRGTRVQRLRCDEVELFKPEVWEAAQLTTRSKQCGDVLVRGSVECLSTMHRAFGLMHTLVKEARAANRAVFRWSLVDTLASCPPEHRCDSCVLWDECRGRAKSRPAAHCGHLEVADAVRMKSRVSMAAWYSEMLCLRPSRTDLVFPDFEPHIHIIEEDPYWAAGVVDQARSPETGEPQDDDPSQEPAAAPILPEPWRTGLAVPPDCHWVCGMDFGFRAPTAILWGVVDPEGVLWIVDERILTQVTLEEHIEAIQNGWGDGWRASRGFKERPPEGSPRGWPRPDWIGVDPAGNQTNDQTGRSAVATMKAAGLTVRGIRMNQAPGIKLVRARLRPAAPSLAIINAGIDGGLGAGINSVALATADAAKPLLNATPLPPHDAPPMPRPALEADEELDEIELELTAGRGGRRSGPPRIFIHRRCQKLIESLEQYHYRTDRPDSDVPVKDGPDHAVDALRYLIQNLDNPRQTRVTQY
jgi:hypothetical protein